MSAGTDQIWYEYTRTNVDLCFISGLVAIYPPWFAGKPKWYRFAWRVYQNLTEFILYATTVTNLVGAVLLTSIFDVFASLPPLIHGIQMTGRLIVLKYRSEAIATYIRELNDALAEDLRNPIETTRTFRDNHAGDFTMNRRLTALEFVSLIMSNVVFFCPEFIKSLVRPDDAHVIIVSWYPYDTNVTLNKQLTNAAHTFSWLLINFKMASLDTVFQSFIILHTSMFKQLRHHFGLILPESMSRDGMAPFPRDVDEALVRKLRWWISQHQRTLTATKRLQDICSPLLLFSYVECLFNMCLCAFLTTVDNPWTPLQRFSAVFVVGTVFVQMFVMCRLGDYLEETSILVPELGYNPTIFRGTAKIRRSMVNILMRMHRPVTFSALGLFFLNSKNYGALVQGVFSYYMALRQFQSRGDM